MRRRLTRKITNLAGSSIQYLERGRGRGGGVREDRGQIIVATSTLLRRRNPTHHMEGPLSSRPSSSHDAHCNNSR